MKKFSSCVLVLAMAVLSTSELNAQSYVLSGKWFNTTFGTFGDLDFEFHANETTGVVTGVFDLGTGVFGNPADIPPVNYNGILNPSGVANFNSPGSPIGDFIGMFNRNTNDISVRFENIPSPFVFSADYVGTLDRVNGLNMTFRVNFNEPAEMGTGIEMQDFAVGTVAASVVPEPMQASLLVLGICLLGASRHRRRRDTGFAYRNL